ncbi:MAG TPA: helix-hairpin-helix domain-containing protein [Bacteroidales bacterium]|nr:helix-hairpin-helix domain-containing protein [Bacteroidales bacterium]HOX78250.1 helix-hairpin-helix domain-containing protein [Bacteroidales bacterium]
MMNRIKDYFSFSAKEQRGLIALLGIILLALSAGIYLPVIIPQKQFDIEPFRSEVEAFLAKAVIEDSSAISNQNQALKFTPVSDHQDLEGFQQSPYPFNPNELDESQWKNMGLRDRIVNNIMNYRKKGGRFRDKEGFRKIYGLTDKEFGILESYLVFDPPVKSEYPKDTASKPAGFQDQFTKKEFLPIRVEINSADSSALLNLKGIGPSFAGRIVKYRSRLGGFYKPEQLMEIRGLDSVRFNQFRDQIELNSGLISKIDINNVTFKELLKHPYFEYYLVKAIFEKKDQIKSFDSVEQIKYLPVMYEELFEKISPYITVN